MAFLIWTVPFRLVLGVGAMLVLACLSYAAAFQQCVPASRGPAPAPSAVAPAHTPDRRRDISKPLPPGRRRLVAAARHAPSHAHPSGRPLQRARRH